MQLTSLALSCALLGVTTANNSYDTGVVPMSFRVHRPDLDINVLKSTSSLRKRDDGTSDVTLLNYLTSYVAEISVGTPGQNMSVVLDTGSSDLWVMGSGNPYCLGSGSSDVSEGKQVDCSQANQFNTDDSSSYSDQQTEFSILYGDGTVAQGTFAQDTIQVGSFSLDKANFAVATLANTTMAVFGIGPIYGESTVKSITQDGQASSTYDNLLVQMKSQGYISSLSFSLWLNQANSGSGSVLFGGIDTTKYADALTLFPIIKDLSLGSFDNVVLEQPRSTSVMMTGLGLYKDSDTAMVGTGNFPVLLDSGTSLSYLPDEFVEALAGSVGATWSTAIGMYITTCDHEGGVIFELSGTQYQVPFQQMIYYLTEDGTNGAITNATDENGDAICGLGLMSSGSYAAGNTYILGETFLRGVYVAYDFENWQIAIAPAKYGLDTELASSVTSIGTDGIPSATSAPSYSATTFQTDFSTSTATIFDSQDSIDDNKTYVVDTTAMVSSDVPASTGSSDDKTVTSGAASAGSSDSDSVSGAAASGSSSGTSGGSSSGSSTSSSSNSAHFVTAGFLAPLLIMLNCI